MPVTITMVCTQTAALPAATRRAGPGGGGRVAQRGGGDALGLWVGAAAEVVTGVALLITQHPRRIEVFLTGAGAGYGGVSRRSGFRGK